MGCARLFRLWQLRQQPSAEAQLLGSCSAGHNLLWRPAFAGFVDPLNPTWSPTCGGIPTAGGIHKFVDTLPGLTSAGANNLGQYIPVAVPDTTSYPGSDYYEIALVQYTQKMHTDLNPTTLRGYVQISTTAVPGCAHRPDCIRTDQPILNAAGAQVYAVAAPSYLGPAVVATKVGRSG